MIDLIGFFIATCGAVDTLVVLAGAFVDHDPVLVAETRLDAVLAVAVVAPSALLDAFAGRNAISVLAQLTACLGRSELGPVNVLAIAHAVAVVVHGRLGSANALIGLVAGAGGGALPVGDALVAGRTFPTGFAETLAGSLAVAVTFVAAFAANGLIAEVTRPALSARARVRLALLKRGKTE